MRTVLALEPAIIVVPLGQLREDNLINRGLTIRGNEIVSTIPERSK